MISAKQWDSRFIGNIPDFNNRLGGTPLCKTAVPAGFLPEVQSGWDHSPQVQRKNYMSPGIS